MAKRPKKKTGDLNDPALRIAWLVENLWNGSQSRAAEETGVRQGSLSNVLTGKRQPGQDMLLSIGKHPLVNPAWLLAGEGSPMMQDVLTPVLGEAALPVIRELFDGTPDQNGDKLQGYLLPVPRRLYRETRYWVPVTDSHPLADETLCLRAGDHVLFEPDAHGWPAASRDFPCIVRAVGRKKHIGLQFGRLLCDAKDVRDTTDVELFGSTSDRQDQAGNQGLDYHKPQTSIQLDKKMGDAARLKVVAVGIFRCGGFAS